MTGTTIKLTLDRFDLGVAVTDSTPDVFSTIVDITVPAGQAYVLNNHTPFVIKLADSSNVLLTRNGEIIIGYKKSGDTLPREVCRWDYGVFYDLSIANQRSKNYREQVAMSIEGPYLSAREDEHLVLQVKHATPVDISQANNIIEFNVDKVLLP